MQQIVKLVQLLSLLDIQLVELVLDIHSRRFDLECAIRIEHHGNVLLAADGHRTIGRPILGFDVMPRIFGAKLLKRVLRLLAITAPCCAIDVNSHVLFLLS